MRPAIPGVRGAPLRRRRYKTPRTGLDAMERGILVHHVLAQVMEQLKTKNALDAIDDDDLEAMLMHAAKEAIAHIRRDRPASLSGRFAEIEQRRLVRLAREWLNEERKRSEFAVIAIEDKRSIEIGGLALTTRLDRVDEFGDGRRIIIDYKTRAPSVSTMLGDRPEEPQLPLYLVTAEQDAVAVAFAQVRIGDMRFVALARDSDLLPGMKALPSRIWVIDMVRGRSWLPHGVLILLILRRAFPAAMPRSIPRNFHTLAATVTYDPSAVLMSGWRVCLQSGKTAIEQHFAYARRTRF